MQVDEERATTSIPHVPDTLVGKRAKRNICLKMLTKHDKNRKQITLAEKHAQNVQNLFYFNKMQLFAANANSNIFFIMCSLHCCW